MWYVNHQSNQAIDLSRVRQFYRHASQTIRFVFSDGNFVKVTFEDAKQAQAEFSKIANRLDPKEQWK